ncbi:MAG: putative zinc-binding protein [Syntrophorhabdaceae bacterium]|nr:putative zinc-binding protein [Syntrophorhabdaceae bacterium]MDD4197126.1 putative zinc-binding protein [Syntrophorhabdaceae bacterium]
MKTKIMILPCSGIGKAYGEIGRQAVYEAVDNRPDISDTVCLGRLMIEDHELKDSLKNGLIITVDGCARDCAKKIVESIGEQANSSFRVIEVFKDHRDLKPAGILELGDAGFQLAHILAERVVSEIDRLSEEENKC